MAWLLRLAILATALAHLVRGDLVYGVFCLGAIALVMAPALLVRSSHGNVPVELELAILWWMVADMTLGQLGGLYVMVPWFDKVLHLGNSILLGMIAFLAVYVNHFAGKSRAHLWVDGFAILIVTLGLGALWEIGEYVADRLLHRATQGAPGMTPLDDTMWDLILDGLGGVLGALLGPLYMRHSKRSRRRIDAFAAIVAQRERAPGP